jgi:hypothetical protein
VLFPGAGSELYRGLGSVVLGGLIVSTLFTLVLVPTVFGLTLRARARLARLLFGTTDMFSESTLEADEEAREPALHDGRNGEPASTNGKRTTETPQPTVTTNI